ncbi:MAG: HlyD family efflux transporter periplasmic adaptor subunit [Saprospiraceae bacterium]
MLNISKNSISNAIRLSDFSSFKLLRKNPGRKVTLWIITILPVFILLCLFLPWTQNINAKGYVTTRSPQQRPQAIQSVIAGQLDKWFVQEGDYVEQGDTVVFLTEVKNDYFDPNILTRTSEQITAKTQSSESYIEKIKALQNQYNALLEALKLKQEQNKNKIQQAKNKISIDSIDLEALTANLEIAKNQLSRTQELYDKGLKTLTELQDKEYKVQNSQAKVNVQINKLINQRNELLNLTIELVYIEKDYADKLFKSQSERQSAISSKLETMAETSKLKNQLSNYTERQKFYYIIAPQAGYITKTIKKGIGEIVKEGADVATIVPSKYDLAIEIYILPQDLPLISVGNLVQLRFDGWPAIVISGWPKASTGLFTGNIVAMDRYTNDNGKYRVLISPKTEKKNWPEQLSIGAGARAFLLLKKVPIWYEIWRQLNGFPPDYYQKDQKNDTELYRKPPIKSIK